MYQTPECVNLILKKGDTPYIGRITFTFCVKEIVDNQSLYLTVATSVSYVNCEIVWLVFSQISSKYGLEEQSKYSNAVFLLTSRLVS